MTTALVENLDGILTAGHCTQSGLALEKLTSSTTCLPANLPTYGRERFPGSVGALPSTNSLFPTLILSYTIFTIIHAPPVSFITIL